MFELWLEMSGKQMSENAQTMLRIAWYNGANSILMLSRDNPSNEMRDKVLADLEALPGELGLKAVNKNGVH